MTTPTDDLNGFPYVSSAPDLLAPEVEPNYQDQADLPVLEKMFKVLQLRKAHYRSTDALSLGVDLTIENQLIINKQMQLHIQELESLLTSSITKVREKMNERQS